MNSLNIIPTHFSSSRQDSQFHVASLLDFKEIRHTETKSKQIHYSTARPNNSRKENSHLVFRHCFTLHQSTFLASRSRHSTSSSVITRLQKIQYKDKSFRYSTTRQTKQIHYSSSGMSYQGTTRLLALESKSFHCSPAYHQIPWLYVSRLRDN